MIGMANLCLTSLKQDISPIMEIAQNYYNNVFDQDFGLEGVPRDPESSALAPHFGEGILYVGDADEEGEPIHNYLFFPIAWDEEHGFYLELKNGSQSPMALLQLSFCTTIKEMSTFVYLY